LADDVMSNRLDPNEARQVLDDVRKANQAKKFKQGTTCNNNNESDDNPLLIDQRLKGIEKSMIEMIQSEIVTNLGNVDWDSIAGLEFAKRKIQRIAIQPLVRPDIFTGLRKPQRGLYFAIRFLNTINNTLYRPFTFWTSWNWKNFDWPLHCNTSECNFFFNNCFYSNI